MKNLNWYLLALGWITFFLAIIYSTNTLYYIADVLFVASVVAIVIKTRRS